MKLCAAFALATVLGSTSVAHADGEMVLSAGPEVGILDAPGQELPELHNGFFLRLALTPGLPGYTTAPRGYRWLHGFSGELTVRAGKTDRGDDDRYAGAEVGLRYDIAFSQRRMGLLQVSARGGFYVAARAGVIRANSFGGPDYTIQIVPNGSDMFARAPDTQRVGSAAFGTYIMLGDSLQLGTELGAFAMGYSRDVDPRVGAIIRVSLGATL